jgi:hypothetical protein
VPNADARGGFTQTTGELPLRARCTTRLRTALLTAVIDQGQPVAQVAQDPGVAWWTAQRCVNAAALVLPDVDRLHVTQLGIDEHRYRRVRWFRDPDQGGWRRVEPWMTTLVNVASGQVLGVVDARDSAAVQAWLGHRSQLWRDRIQIVAIDPSAAFKKAITTALPAARIAVDPFHLVQLANLCLTRVRQRLVQEHQQWGTTGSDAPFSYIMGEHHSYAVCRQEPSLTMAWGMNVYDREEGDELVFDWAKQFINPAVRPFWVDFFWNGALLDRVELATIDGTHGTIPIPDAGLEVSDFEVAVANLIHELESGRSGDRPDRYLDSIGVRRVRDDERLGAGSQELGQS